MARNYKSEYEKKLKAKSEREDAFLSKLDESMKKEFYNIMEMWSEAYPLELREYFLRGYKLGIKMMIAVYEE